MPPVMPPAMPPAMPPVELHDPTFDARPRQHLKPQPNHGLQTSVGVHIRAEHPRKLRLILPVSL